jgi:hypothetical protein
VCHFRNILNRDPFPSWGKDAELPELFRRADLDSFWARETSTVKHNFREVKRIEDFAKDMEMPPMCPPNGTDAAQRFERDGNRHRYFKSIVE